MSIRKKKIRASKIETVNAGFANTLSSIQKRKFLSIRLQKESKLVQKESFKVLAEFEKIDRRYDY
jgi:DUF4097 and DUF4098 domain-containing protein YvlB